MRASRRLTAASKYVTEWAMADSKTKPVRSSWFQDEDYCLSPHGKHGQVYYISFMVLQEEKRGKKGQAKERGFAGPCPFQVALVTREGDEMWHWTVFASGAYWNSLVPTSTRSILCTALYT